MKNSIPALLPRGEGRHFLLYGDSCSGVPGGPHERPLPPSMPSFVACNRNPSSSYFFGDEIIGLTSDAESLREQWRHWLETEMAWVDPPLPDPCPARRISSHPSLRPLRQCQPGQQHCIGPPAPRRTRPNSVEPGERSRRKWSRRRRLECLPLLRRADDHRRGLRTRLP